MAIVLETEVIGEVYEEPARMVTMTPASAAPA